MKPLIFITLLASSVLPALAAAPGQSPDTDNHLRYQRLPGHSPIRQLLDVHYIKSEITDKKPVIIWIHGGAWKFGNKTHSITSKAQAFVSAGYILVAVNYRFYPQVNWSDQAKDVAAATRWVTRNINKYGGDPQRIALMGHSAGAHLAALVGADPSYLQAADVPSGSVKAVVLLDGAGYNLPALMKSARGQHLKLYQEVFGNDPIKLKAASPLHQFKTGHKHPSYLIIPVSSRAITITQSEQLAKAIRKAGGHAQVTAAKNRSHMTLNQKIGHPGDKPTQDILAFLKTRL